MYEEEIIDINIKIDNIELSNGDNTEACIELKRLCLERDGLLYKQLQCENLKKQNQQKDI